MAAYNLVDEFRKNRKKITVLVPDDFISKIRSPIGRLPGLLNACLLRWIHNRQGLFKKPFNKGELKPDIEFQRLVVGNEGKCSGGRDTIGELGCYQGMARLVIQDLSIGGVLPCIIQF